MKKQKTPSSSVITVGGLVTCRGLKSWGGEPGTPVTIVNGLHIRVCVDTMLTLEQQGSEYRIETR